MRFAGLIGFCTRLFLFPFPPHRRRRRERAAGGAKRFILLSRVEGRGKQKTGVFVAALPLPRRLFPSAYVFYLHPRLQAAVAAAAAAVALDLQHACAAVGGRSKSTSWETQKYIPYRSLFDPSLDYMREDELLCSASTHRALKGARAATSWGSGVCFYCHRRVIWARWGGGIDTCIDNGTAM